MSPIAIPLADFYPNGIDFAMGVTGRYCNGGTLVDHLGNLLGLPLIPPFNNPNTRGSNILKGVNYASGAAGILWDTGLIYGDVFTMDEQIQNFRETLDELSRLLGNETQDFVGRSVSFICMGANDYINNYLHPLTRKDNKYTATAYVQLLIHEYRRQIKEIYDLGARKFLIAGIPALGCTPNQIGASSDSRGECVKSSNQLALQFNSHVQVLVQELNTTLAASSFLFWDTFQPLYSIISNYSLYGFKYPNKACCGGGRAKGQIICLPVLPLECHNRSEYIFWDPFHPTDAMNAIVSKDAYNLLLQSWDLSAL